MEGGTGVSDVTAPLNVTPPLNVSTRWDCRVCGCWQDTW